MMVKMKKALGSLALVLALAMAISILPTIVLASNTTAITTQAGSCYNPETGTVTVEGTISSSAADVTVLAVRSADQITNATTYFGSVTEIENKIVYIDQVGAEDTANYTVNGDSANWDFTFIPKTGVSGGWITVFVGGTDVDEIKFVSFSAQVAAPGLTANAWYKGDDLVMKIHKAGDAASSYGAASDITAWGNAIDKVIVNGSEIETYTIDAAAGTITFTGLASVSSINIKTVNGEYAEINMTGLTLAPSDRPAGTITAVSSTVVENDQATVSFNIGDSTPAGWLAAINAGAVKYSEKGANNFADVSSYDLTGGVLKVGIASIGAAESKDFTVKIAVTNYAEVTADVKVVAPTKAALDAFSNANVVSAYKNPADLANSDYGVTATTPTEGLNGVSVAWKLQIKNGESWTDVAPLTSGSEYLVGRIEGYTGGDYRALATISKGGFAEVTWSKSFSVSAYGVAGVDVKVTTAFDNTALAAAATLKIMDGTNVVATLEVTADTQDFTAKNVTAGAYKLVIARPGYVTFTVDCTVDSGLANGITVTLPAMVSGDVTDDGKVNINDFNKLKANFNLDKSKTPDKWTADSTACDFTGDNKININDFNKLKSNFNYDRSKVK